METISKWTKATGIPQKVKTAVWERDNHKCIVCGSIYASPCCHIVRRSKGGKGIEENIVTLCGEHHTALDAYDKNIEFAVREYIKSKYPDWEEEKMIYRRLI